MIAISLGIIMFAFLIPVYVVPAALAISEMTSCTDYGCANAVFSKCGGFSSSSSEQDSSNFMSSWTKGMEGMMCMMGIEMSSSSDDTHSSGQIALNSA